MSESTATSEPHDQISREQFEKILNISKNLMAASCYFDRPKIWSAVTREIRSLFDCELASLFLLDDNDPDWLVLESQDPPRVNKESLRLHLASETAGMTVRAATHGKSLAIDYDELRQARDTADEIPGYLPSRLFYSVLYAPLKNRKGKLVGLLRLNNKSISTPHERAAFSETDLSAISFLAEQIVVMLENAYASHATQNLIEEIQKCQTKRSIVNRILDTSMRLLHADFSQIGIWNPQKSELTSAGMKTRRLQPLSDRQQIIDRGSVIHDIWARVLNADTNLPLENEPDIVLNNGPDSTSGMGFSHPAAISSASIILRVHQQPVGVLHLESFSGPGFDDLDVSILKTIRQNISVAVQSWQPESEEDFEFEQELNALSVGLHRSILKHLPLVMWRKNLAGKFTWVNDQFCKTVGLKRSEVLGKTDDDIFPPEFAKRFKEGDAIAIREGRYEDSEEKYIIDSTDKRYIHVIKLAIRDSLGQTRGTQGVFLDVTSEKYRQLFNQAPIGFHELDSDGRVVHVNDAEQQLLGYTEEEMKWKKYSEFSGPDWEITQKLIESQLAKNGDEMKWHPINLYKRNLVTVPALLNCRQLKNASDITTGLICVIRELSAGSEIEAALRDPDPRYLKRIRELSIPVFCVDKYLRVTFANDAYLRKDGYDSLKDVFGKTGPELYPRFGVRYHSDSEFVLTSGEVLDRFESHFLPSGEETLVRVLKFPIRDSHKRIVGVQGVFWNYDEQDQAIKELTTALEGAKEEYRQIVNQASEGIFRSQSDGKLVVANPAMLKLMGYESEEEIVGLPFGGLERFAIESELNEYLSRLRSAKPDAPSEYEYRLRRQNGEEIWVAESIQMERATDVKRSGFVSFVTDVTQRKRDEAELQRSLEDKEAMLTMLSHQLRSPVWQSYERANHLVEELDPHGLLAEGKAVHPVPRLAAIRGLTRKTRGVAWSIEMISKLAHSEQVEITKKNGIAPRNLLKMARESAVDVQLLRRVSTSFLQRIGRTNHVPDFEINTSVSLESRYRIVGDPDLIEQCVGNLVENAFKYSLPKSTILIRLILEYRNVTLNVRNKPLPGLEIDSSSKDKCKEKHWRSKGAESTDADGSGLGLWFAERIMLAHGGKLLVSETDINGWNSFSLWFPLE